MQHPRQRLISKLRSSANWFFSACAIVCLTTTPASAAIVRIMPLGDSVTAGYTDTNPFWQTPYSFGYRAPLYTRLTQACYDFQFVGECQEPWVSSVPAPTTFAGPVDLRGVNQEHHRGYGGTVFSHLQNGLDGTGKNGIANWMVVDDPDIVLLAMGINDIYYYGNGGNPTGVESSLNTLVSTILTAKPTVKLIVAQINSYKDGSLTNSVVAYNDYIKNTLVPHYAGQLYDGTNHYNVTTVDQYANFLKSDGSIDQSLYSNIIHPNMAGYDLMAQTWFNGIQAVMTPEPSVLSLLIVLGLSLLGDKCRHVFRRRRAA